MNKIFNAAKGVLLGLMFLGLYFAVTLSVSLCYYCFASNKSANYEEAMAGSNSPITIISAVLTTIIAVMIFKERNKNIAEHCQIKIPKLMLLLTAFVAGISINMVFSAVSEVVSIPNSWKQAHDQSVSTALGGNLVLVLISAMLIAPAIEEFLFRGLFFGFVKSHWNEIAAVILSSAVFGIAHGNPLQAIYTILGGFAFCYFRISGSLWYSIVAHMGFNMGNIVTILLGVDSPWLRIAAGALLLIASMCGFVLFKNIYNEKNKEKELN